MKKQITTSELKSLIREEAQKLNRRTILENEKKKLQIELRMIESEDIYKELNNYLDKALSTEPEFNFEVTRKSNLSSRYQGREVIDFESSLNFSILNSEEELFEVTINLVYEMEEDPDGASSIQNNTMQIEGPDFSGDYYVSGAGLNSSGEDITPYLSPDVIQKIKNNIEKLDDFSKEEHEEYFNY
jgi:hypothetical protein